MNAANSLETKPKPTADQRLPEPSMEEILASIRRIIADDESLPGHKDVPAEAHEPVTAEAPEPDLSASQSSQGTPADTRGEELSASPESVLSVGELVSNEIREDEVTAPSADVSSGRRSAFMKGYEASQVIAEPDEIASYAIHEEPVAAEDEIHGTHVPAEEPVSPAIDTPVDREMHGLSSEALFSEATNQSVAAAFRTLAATRLTANSEELLDIARDMIRPLLKSWIDNNVPMMVERMVRAEIERVARGGR